MTAEEKEEVLDSLDRINDIAWNFICGIESGRLDGNDADWTMAEEIRLMVMMIKEVLN